MKRCFKCGIEKEIDEFYRHPAMADGHLGKCKECAKKDVKERSILKSEYVRAYDRKRSRTPVRAELRKRLGKREQEQRPERYVARYTLTNAVRDGRIIKPDTCEICGAKGKIHGHHFDYSRPLDVIWLCVLCHQQIH